MSADKHFDSHQILVGARTAPESSLTSNSFGVKSSGSISLKTIEGEDISFNNINIYTANEITIEAPDAGKIYLDGPLRLNPSSTPPPIGSVLTATSAIGEAEWEVLSELSGLRITGDLEVEGSLTIPGGTGIGPGTTPAEERFPIFNNAVSVTRTVSGFSGQAVDGPSLLAIVSDEVEFLGSGVRLAAGATPDSLLLRYPLQDLFASTAVVLPVENKTLITGITLLVGYAGLEGADVEPAGGGPGDPVINVLLTKASRTSGTTIGLISQSIASGDIPAAIGPASVSLISLTFNGGLTDEDKRVGFGDVLTLSIRVYHGIDQAGPTAVSSPEIASIRVSADEVWLHP